MLVRTRTTLLLTAALIAAVGMANNAYAGPPSMGIIKDYNLISPGAANKKPKKDNAIIAPGSMTLIPGAAALIPGPGNLIPPQPGGGGGNGGGGNPPADPPQDPPQNPPSNPDWVDILNGIGGILNGGGNPGHGHGGHGGHHPGHYPGQYPDYTPDYLPGYPTPGSSSSSYVPSNPLPETPVDPGMAVVVANPAKNDATISFLADGRQYTLAPGYQQVVKQSGKVEVRFDRGGSFGLARYTLQDGVFQFLVGQEGWNLYRKVYRVTLDNTANPFPFRYLVGNTVEEVPANGTREYEENEPLVIRFDPGTGQAAKRTLDTGTYHIALNPDLRMWELQEVGPEAAIPDVASNLPLSPPLPMGTE